MRLKQRKFDTRRTAIDCQDARLKRFHEHLKLINGQCPVKVKIKKKSIFEVRGRPIINLRKVLKMLRQIEQIFRGCVRNAG